MDTWLIWNLTGGTDGGLHITDVTNASRTMLMDLKTLDWDAGIMDVMGVPRAMLPEIKASSEVYGDVKSGALQGVPLAGDLGDQQAATFGQTCFSVGEAKNTYGTGNFLLLNTGTDLVVSKSGLLTTVGYKIGDQDAIYCLEGSIAITGALVQWLRDNLKMIKAAPEVEDLAQIGRRQRRLLHRAGLLGPVRAVLEVQRPRRDRGPDALRHRGPHRPRHARGDGVPEPRGRRGDERRLRRRAGVVEGRRRHGRQRPADAVPGRPARRAGDPAEGARDHVARRRLRRRARHRALERAEDLRENWVEDKRWEPTMDADKRDEYYRYWKKAVTRTFDWFDADDEQLSRARHAPARRLAPSRPGSLQEEQPERRSTMGTHDDPNRPPRATRGTPTIGPGPPASRRTRATRPVPTTSRTRRGGARARFRARARRDRSGQARPLQHGGGGASGLAREGASRGSFGDSDEP